MQWLSSESIDNFGEGLVKSFMSNQQQKGFAVDIEGFVTQYLKLPIEYHSFAESDMSKLAFISDGITPLKISENGKVRSMTFPKGTIIIENCLREKSEIGRRRFSISHEAAHFLFDRSIAVASYHREFDSQQSYTLEDFKKIFNINESLVDRLAAAILMPEFMVREYFQSKNRDSIAIYDDNFIRPEDNIFLQCMALDMGVSLTALKIRIRQLGLYINKPIGEYLYELGLERGNV